MKPDLSIFRKCQENSSFIKIRHEKTGTLHEDQFPLLYHISLNSSKKRYALDRSCIENQNTHFAFCNFLFSKTVPLKDNVEKYCSAGLATYNMAHMLCVLDM